MTTPHYASIARIVRKNRVTRMAEAGAKAFSWKHVTHVPERARRFLEEAIEVHQAAVLDRAEAHRIVDHVYDREVGDLPQEIGGCGVTLELLADAAGCDAEFETAKEADRFETLPLERLHASRKRKELAGISTVDDERRPDPTPVSEEIHPKPIPGEIRIEINPPLTDEEELKRQLERMVRKPAPAEKRLPTDNFTMPTPLGMPTNWPNGGLIDGLGVQGVSGGLGGIGQRGPSQMHGPLRTSLPDAVRYMGNG